MIPEITLSFLMAAAAWQWPDMHPDYAFERLCWEIEQIHKSYPADEHTDIRVKTLEICKGSAPGDPKMMYPR